MISMQYHSKNLSCHYQYAPHSKVDIPQIRRNPPDMLLFCPKPNIIDYLPPRQPVEEVARRTLDCFVTAGSFLLLPEG